MTSAELFKEKLERLLEDGSDSDMTEEMEDGGRTIGGKKKKKVGAYQKKLGRLMKSGLTMKQAHKKLQAAGGSDDIIYAYPEDAELERMQQEYELKKMEIENKKAYKRAKQQVLEEDKRLGPIAKLEREFAERDRIIKAMKSQTIPTAKKKEIAKEFMEKEWKPLTIPAGPYVPKEVKYDDASVKLIKEGKGRKKSKK